MKKAFIQVLSVCCLVAAWEVAARAVGQPALFPPLEKVARQLGVLLVDGDFYRSVAATLGRAAAGAGAACVAAFALGTAAAFSEACRAFLRPAVVLVRSVPVISFVLLALIWFSADGLPVFIALVTMFPILYQSTLTALTATDPRWVEMAAVLGHSPLGRFVRVYLPAARGQLYDGLGTALGFGWRAAVMGEALAQPLRGIGSGMKEAQSFIQTPRLLAWTLVAIATGYALDALVQGLRRVRLERRLPAARPFALPAAAASAPLREVRVAGLTKRYGAHTVLADYEARFDNTAITCLRGVSGRGKTTLLRLVAGLERPDGGRVEVRPPGTLACSFQDDRLLPWLTAEANIALAIVPRCRDRQHAADLCAYLLARMGLEEMGDKYPAQLSGGQRQRVNLARALAARADILLLDEPLTGLDEATKRRTLDLILDWTRAYRPLVLWATHEDIPHTRQVVL